MKTNILAILRSPRFSPNSEEKDRLIMKALTDNLSAEGHAITTINEEDIQACYDIINTDNCRAAPCLHADIILNMGRKPTVLKLLKEKEASGTIVINSPKSIEACNRRQIDMLMRQNGMPVAPENGKEGWWIKRCDETAQTANDIRYAANEQEKVATLMALKQRNITDVLVTAHVPGDLIKFYGIADSDFFATFYPTDDCNNKFQNEKINGKARHYIYNEQEMRDCAEKIAHIIGISFYGGDCIVKRDGSFVFIDFNDWPSFSRCREAASQTMAQQIKQIINRL